MGNINILEPRVRGKIAAGEVITRPVSVVKELLENAVDAGATNIDITITEGGRVMCALNDNGTGIMRDDVVHAVERYATSKIKQIDDLERIVTYGFRGEALASIAQVSRMVIETSDGRHGTRMAVAGGVIQETVDSCRPRGTRVQVEDLFYNLPARLKFLKSSQREKQLIVELVREYATICTDVHFTITADSREVSNIPGSKGLIERMRMLVPRTVHEMFVPFSVSVGDIKMDGLFTRPDFQRRHSIKYLSINRRPIKYPRLYRTIMQVYQNPKQPPAFVLHIHVPSEYVDVNIHPTKREVKLRDERYIIDILTQALKQKIVVRSPGVSISTPEQYAPAISDRKADKTARFVQDAAIQFPKHDTARLDASHDAHEFWQVHDMFIFAQTKSGLIIVDQHAAHERIVYESIMKGKSESQRLLFPLTLELSPEEYRTYRKTRTVLRELGIDFKEFSSRTIVIDSTPSDTRVSRDDLVGLFKDIDGLGSLIKEKSEIAKVIACHTAIKAGQRLSEIEMQSLIDKLFACEYPYTCPHGRPAVIRFSKDELAAKFGRT